MEYTKEGKHFQLVVINRSSNPSQLAFPVWLENRSVSFSLSLDICNGKVYRFQLETQRLFTFGRLSYRERPHRSRSEPLPLV